MIFSVIVPFLNEEKWIESCLESLLNQDFDKGQYELIFVDNDSNDRSPDMVRRYPITLLHEKRRDPYIARNRGIEAAKGKYIVFTDSDCIADRQWLRRLHERFEASNADIMMGRLLYPAPTPLSLECQEEYYHTKLMDICEFKRSEYYYGHAGNMAVRASVFEEAGLFSGMPIVGDTEIIHNLILQRPDAKIIYEPEAKVIHAEVRHLGHYLYKLFECGQYSETYSHSSNYRPLELKDNIRLAKNCLKTYRYSLWKTFVFGSSLVAGFLFYKAGRIKRRFQKPDIEFSS